MKKIQTLFRYVASSLLVVVISSNSSFLQGQDTLEEAIAEQTNLLNLQTALQEAQINLLKTQYNVPDSAETPRQAAFEIKTSDSALTESHFMAYTSLGNAISVEIEDLLHGFPHEKANIIVDVVADGDETIAFGVSTKTLKDALSGAGDTKLPKNARTEATKVSKRIERILNDQTLQTKTAELRLKAYISAGVKRWDDNSVTEGNAVGAVAAAGAVPSSIATASLMAVGTLNSIAEVLDYFKIDQTVTLTKVNVSNKAMEALVVSAMKKQIQCDRDVNYFSSRDIPVRLSTIPALVGQISKNKTELQGVQGSVQALQGIIDAAYIIYNTHADFVIAQDQVLDTNFNDNKASLKAATSEIAAKKKRLKEIEEEKAKKKEEGEAADAENDEGNNEPTEEEILKEEIEALEASVTDLTKEVAKRENDYKKVEAAIDRLIAMEKVVDEQTLLAIENNLQKAIEGMTKIENEDFSEEIREDSIQCLLADCGIVIKCAVEFTQAETTVQKAPLFLKARVRSAGGSIFWYEAFNSQGKVLAGGVAGRQEKQGLFKFVRSKPLWKKPYKK